MLFLRRFNATPEDLDILCYVNGSITSRMLADIWFGSESSSSSSSSSSEEDRLGFNRTHNRDSENFDSDENDHDYLSLEGLGGRNGILSGEPLGILVNNRTRNVTVDEHPDQYDDYDPSEEYSSEVSHPG